MKKFVALLLAALMVLTACVAMAEADVITVGIVNNPPSESGYREANVKDFEAVFTAENGYEAKTFYSLKNDEQLAAAQQFITDGVDYLLISAAETTGWDEVLTAAQEAGIGVFLFDRMIAVDESLYTAAVVSDMANQGKLATEWLKRCPSTRSSTSRALWVPTLSWAVPARWTSRLPLPITGRSLCSRPLPGTKPKPRRSPNP